MKKSGQNATKSGLSKKQRDAAEMLANPDFEGSKTDISAKVGVARSTLHRWFRDPEFTRYVDELIDTYTDSELGTVWKALIKRCYAGDTKAIKLYFELKGKYKQQVEHSVASDFVFNILPASERTDAE